VWIITSISPQHSLTVLKKANRKAVTSLFYSKYKSNRIETRVKNEINLSVTEEIIPEMFSFSLCVRSHPTAHWNKGILVTSYKGQVSCMLLFYKPTRKKTTITKMFIMKRHPVCTEWKWNADFWVSETATQLVPYLQLESASCIANKYSSVSLHIMTKITSKCRMYFWKLC
jgi:hypothetical protein